MSKTARVINLLAVVRPPIVIAAAIAVFWNDVVGVHDLALLLAMYGITGFGVTVGFHRMLTHRAFRTSKPVEYLFAAAGSMAVQGPVIKLGRRPSQAPRAHGRGGRPAQPAR